MANSNNKQPENVPGKFFVDTDCIDCDLCREVAPENFNRKEDPGYSFVAKQPDTVEEIQRCTEALQSCPVNAIGQEE